MNDDDAFVHVCMYVHDQVDRKLLQKAVWEKVVHFDIYVLGRGEQRPLPNI